MSRPPWPASSTTVTPARSALRTLLENWEASNRVFSSSMRSGSSGGRNSGARSAIGIRTGKPTGMEWTSVTPLYAAISAAFALTSSAWRRPVKRTTTAEYSASPLRSR